MQDLTQKNKLIEDLQKKSKDNKDPISLEAFEEWTLAELNSAVTFNGFSYKETTIMDYIYANTTANERLSYKDPVNSFLTIPKNILDDFKETRIKKQNNFLNLFKFTFHFTTVMSQNKMYYCMFVCVDKKYNSKIEIFPSDLYIVKPNEQYFLGFIPADIELHSNAFMKAIDTMSSSSALLYRISSLYTEMKMVIFDKTKEQQLVLHGLKSILSTEPTSIWKSSCQQKTYELLLEEISHYE